MNGKIPQTKMSIRDIGNILEACELMKKHFGETGQTYLGKLFWFTSKKAQNKFNKALNEYNAFYALPLDERLIKVGFKKNKDGNLEKSIIL